MRPRLVPRYSQLFWRRAATGGLPAAPIPASAAFFASGTAAASSSAALSPAASGAVPELLQLVQQLRRGAAAEGRADEASRAHFEEAGKPLQLALVDAPMPQRLELLREVAQLATLPERPFPVAAHLLVFLEEYLEFLEALRDGETIADRAAELREVLLSFHLAGVATERLRLLYTFIEREFPRFEAAGALLPMPAAVRLCHTMLATGMSSPGAVVVLLRSALRQPLMQVADDSQELRQLKMIELLIRLDFLHTQEQLPRDVSEYLGVIRSLRYYDRELRRDTALSYQLAFFLRKHGFPAKRHMLGPYGLKICDPEERVNFEPVPERAWRFGLPEEPPARKRRHLEAVGWRSIEVPEALWRELGHYDAKAAHVRRLLKENDLLSL